MSTPGLLSDARVTVMIQPMVDIERQKRGERISHAIKQAGLTQRKAAQLIGVTPQSITKWIRSGSINKENVQALSDITGVDVRYLIVGNPNAEISQSDVGYRVSISELHALINSLTQEQAALLSLCAKAIIETDDKDLTLNIHVGSQVVL